MTKNHRTAGQDDLGQIDWRDCPHVQRDPESMSGAWCFEGTRLPVSALFTNLATQLTIPEFLEQFPSTKIEHINAVLSFLADRLDTTSER